MHSLTPFGEGFISGAFLLLALWAAASGAWIRAVLFLVLAVVYYARSRAY